MIHRVACYTFLQWTMYLERLEDGDVNGPYCVVRVPGWTIVNYKLDVKQAIRWLENLAHKKHKAALSLIKVAEQWAKNESDRKRVTTPPATT